MDPPVSSPMEHVTRFAATDAPEPPLEVPGLRLMTLNVSEPAPSVAFDIAMIERAGGAGRFGTERACFGSYSPFFILESALLKLKESALDVSVLDANARRLLG